MEINYEKIICPKCKPENSIPIIYTDCKNQELLESVNRGIVCWQMVYVQNWRQTIIVKVWFFMVYRKSDRCGCTENQK